MKTSEGSGGNDSAKGVDVIIRYHRSDRSLELDMALMSVFHQTYAPIRVVLVTQGFSLDELETVHRAVHAYDWSARHAEPTIVPVDSPLGIDARSKLLNSGLSTLKHRYVAFLDFDDYLYSHAYEHLTRTAEVDDAIVTFGGIVVKHVRVFDHSIYNVRRVDDFFAGNDLKDLLSANFCPIHSFIVDRSKVEASELFFDERLTRLEDYDFLLRLAAKHEFSFSGLNRKIGVYNWRLDGSNSVQVFNANDETQIANTRQWNEARRHIWRMQTKVRDVRDRAAFKALNP